MQTIPEQDRLQETPGQPDPEHPDAGLRPCWNSISVVSLPGGERSADNDSLLSTADTTIQPHPRTTRDLHPDEDLRSSLWTSFGPPVQAGLCPRGFVPPCEIDSQNGEVTYVFPCGASSCPVCGKAKIYRLAGRINQTQPDTFVTLTRISGEWSETQKHMQEFMTFIRRQGYDLKIVYAVERNPLVRSIVHHSNQVSYQRSELPRYVIPKRRITANDASLPEYATAFTTSSSRSTNA